LIETVAETGSTNADLLARLKAGEPVGEGHWLVADRQTAGRGRAGRTWFDGYGNFMGSTVAQLRAGDPPPQTLALVAGVAVHRAVQAFATGPDLLLKWPNDLLLNGSKLAGILLERQGDAVVVGIGVNVAVAPEVAGRTTTSLAAQGLPANRDGFAQALATEWSQALTRWHLGEWPVLRQDWLSRAHSVGTLVSVKDREQGELTGAFAGIDEDGVALLRMADGRIHPIHAGDIEMVG
jgi:BirA family biotin operon repressor/biotin-[acetyl-CoA-carboxylase] ligase